MHSVKQRITSIFVNWRLSFCGHLFQIYFVFCEEKKSQDLEQH